MAERFPFKLEGNDPMNLIRIMPAEGRMNVLFLILVSLLLFGYPLYGGTSYDAKPSPFDLS